MSACIDSCRPRAFSRLLGVYLLLPLKEISEVCAYYLLDPYCTLIVFTVDNNCVFCFQGHALIQSFVREGPNLIKFFFVLFFLFFLVD